MAELTKSSLGKKGFIWPKHPLVKKLGEELKQELLQWPLVSAASWLQRPLVSAASWLLLHVLLCYLIQPMPTCLRMELPTVG